MVSDPVGMHYELAAGRPDRWSVVLAEIGDGLEIWHEAPGQPHQFDVTLGLSLQASARRNAVEIAVEIDLQQRRRMVSRPPGGLGDNTVEAQCRQIQFVATKRFIPPSPNSRTLNYHVSAFSHALGGEPTFAEPTANGEVAPTPAVGDTANEPNGSTVS